MHHLQPDRSRPLHGIQASRELERLAQAALPPHTLMQRAGLACARLARALAPHGRTAWIACGPGNNGGDGFEAALHLHRLGWQVHLSWTGARHPPADAQASRERALAAGLQVQAQPPAHFDLAIDALLGLGGDLGERADTALMRQWLGQMHSLPVPVLAIDLPSGLQADTGHSPLPAGGRSQRHTLSLLSLKPGLFTALGRDQAGQVWWDDLGVDITAVPATAIWAGADLAGPAPRRGAPQASHKGSFGEVVVIGGQMETGAGTHMAGAALLAARAALRHGAGRVYLSLLGEAGLHLDPGQPELMLRPAASLAGWLGPQVAVAGCGGGQAVAQVLPQVLEKAQALVLDADGLNAVAADRRLRQALAARADQAATVLTPHPLEAARLLGCSAAQVQADRLQAAQQLADELRCTVVLKGSGTVMAAPGELPAINASGNALLATAGTGDVLAGMVGAALAQGLGPRAAALHAVHVHGARADAWAAQHPQRLLCASDLLLA